MKKYNKNIQHKIYVHYYYTARKTHHGAVSGQQCAVPQDIQGVHIHVTRDSENDQSNSMYNMQVTQHLILQPPVNT